MKLGPRQAVKGGLLSTSLGFTQAPAQWPVLSGAQCLWHIVVLFSRFVFGVLIFPASPPGVGCCCGFSGPDQAARCRWN